MSDGERIDRTDGSQAICLYCLAPSDRLQSIEGTGIGGAPLFAHSFPGFTAVLGAVSLDEFAGDGAEKRLQDLSWVGPRACRHEEVVEQVMRGCPVAPARFGTIFSSLEGLALRLDENKESILGFLERVTDKEEWAVKGLPDRATASQGRISLHLAQNETELASLPPGRRYFQEQRLRREAEKELNDWLNGISRELAEELCRYSPDFRQRKVLSREATRLDGDMVLNWAFLVPRRTIAAFRSRIKRASEECCRQGLHLCLSGPWPPYSFCPSLEKGSSA